MYIYIYIYIYVYVIRMYIVKMTLVDPSRGGRLARKRNDCATNIISLAISNTSMNNTNNHNNSNNHSHNHNICQ